MKQTSLPLIAVLVATTLCMSSCHWSNRPETPSSQETSSLDFSTVAYQDSVNIMDASATQTLRIDFPVSEDSSLLYERVSQWLCEEIANRSYPDWTGEWPACHVRSAELVTFIEDSDDTFGQSLVTFYGQKGMEKMSEALKQVAGDGFFGGYDNHLEIQLTERDGAYLTFSLQHSIYTGGAHGGNISYGKTFRKTDGKSLDWSMFDESKRGELCNLIKEGLKGYFFQNEESAAGVSDEALFDILFLFDNPDTPENELEYGIPLPQNAPWLSSRGIVFIYNEYEIASYADGHPSCVIPFDEIKPLMNPEGSQWLESLDVMKDENSMAATHSASQQ